MSNYHKLGFDSYNYVNCINYRVNQPRLETIYLFDMTIYSLSKTRRGMRKNFPQIYQGCEIKWKNSMEIILYAKFTAKGVAKSESLRFSKNLTQLNHRYRYYNRD